MPKPNKTPRAIPNVHPVDELHALREEIKALQERADEIRDGLLAEGADLNGDFHVGKIIDSKRETLDRKALEEAFGAEMLAPFLKVTAYKTLKIVEK